MLGYTYTRMPLCPAPQSRSIQVPSFPHHVRLRMPGAAECWRPLYSAQRARKQGCVGAGAARKKKEVGAAVEALEEETSTSGRPELEAPVAPAEDVQDVTEIVQAATAAEPVPARQQDSGVLSEEDIRRLATQRREQGRAQKVGFIEGITEEIQLIEWPKPLQAVTDTAVVIALVGTFAVLLFLINSVLAEASKLWYELPINLDTSIAQQIYESFQLKQ